MAYSSSSIIASTTVLLILLFFFLSCRFLARHRSSLHDSKTATSGTSGIGIDDWVAFAAAIGSTIGCLLILVSANEALGRHTFYASPQKVENVLLLIWLDQINYLLVMALAKTSTLLLYTRIFHADTAEQQRFRRLCWGVMGIVILTSFILIIFAIVMCSPVSYFWSRVVEPQGAGRCKDTRPYLYANTIISIVTDMVIVVLPIKQISELHMARKKKITVCALFGLGFIVILCSIMRATSVEDAANRTDPMVDLSGLCMWSLVESAVSVICCCVPACSRLVKDFCVDILGSEKKQESAARRASQTRSKPVTRTWEEDSELGTAGSSRLDSGLNPAVDPRW